MHRDIFCLTTHILFSFIPLSIMMASVCSLLFQFFVYLGPHILVQCMAVNVFFDLPCLKKVRAVVFFHLQTCTIFNKHTVYCTSKFHE